MNILVTGATGFVGGHLTEKLIAAGHTVYALVRNPQKAQFLPSEVITIKGELNWKHANAWTKNLPDRLDTVIHTAGIVHSYHAAHFYDVNAEATRQLIQDLSSREGLRFIFVSSLAAAGPGQRGKPRSEGEADNPISIYGKSKLRAEKYLKATPASWKTAIVRPPMVIGPRDPAVLDIFKMVKSRNVVVPGSRGFENEYSFICVHDLVDLLCELLHFRGRDEVFFSTYGEPCTFDEIIITMARELGVHSFKRINIPLWLLPLAAGTLKTIANFLPISARLTPDKVHELRQEAWTCSDQKAREWLSFKARYNLADTIKLTTSAYKESGLL